MANTTFSGPVISTNGFVFEPSTAALLGVAAGDINVNYKQTGKSVVDLATGIIYTATGSLAVSPWVGSNSSTITPA